MKVLKDEFRTKQNLILDLFSFVIFLYMNTLHFSYGAFVRQNLGCKLYNWDSITWDVKYIRCSRVFNQGPPSFFTSRIHMPIKVDGWQLTKKFWNMGLKYLQTLKKNIIFSFQLYHVYGFSDYLTFGFLPLFVSLAIKHTVEKIREVVQILWKLINFSSK